MNSTTQCHLAQVNIAHLRAPIDSPVIADFVAELDTINALAEQSSGFVWRLVTPEGADATEIEHGFGSDIIVNMSVWETVEDLHHFTYRTAHAQVMSRRKEWFLRMAEVYSVLWWIPQGHVPGLNEAEQKLALLRAEGPGPDAFDFKHAYSMPHGETESLPSRA